ncbi:MAG: NAD(P)(+) transhydrogenase (Re/Si-specific) subunit beta, partial [Chloroflexi bacterium]|nr:NAD(P)(+) transhydrogenase (Re/Si-specific) subunit beta [Chloroflexota bacterium]
MSDSVVDLIYLASAALFIVGLKGLSHPRTAVRGNLLAATAMLTAIVVTLVERGVVDLELIVAGMAVGALAGTVLAVRASLTAMPQLVALFNGLGGGASALVAAVALESSTGAAGVSEIQASGSIGASALVGSVTFWGSAVAFGKLQRLVPERPMTLPGHHLLNGILFPICLALVVWLAIESGTTPVFWALVAVASLLGLLLVAPIGGADMPVAISLLNSCSGLAAAATGFALDSNILIVAGSLVGAAGLILTINMSRAMNRSLTNVLFAGVGAQITTQGETEDIYTGRVKSSNAEEVAMLLEDARRVVIAPGFGMAISQAQYAVRDL